MLRNNTIKGGVDVARAPNEETKKLQAKAESLYKNGMKLVDIAKKIGKPDGTVRRWKKECGWEEKKGADSKKKESERSVKKDKKANVRKSGPGAPKGNKNAVGNHGGAPKKNRNAEKHGFFSKYLPDDALSILDDIENKNFMEILLENIQLSYAAILRSQKIMFVKDKEELIKEIKKVKKKESETNIETEVEWEFQFSWDRQATFLSAQARAMSELRALIRQYEDNATEEQMARIAKIKAETERIKNAAEGKQNEEVDDWISSVTGEYPEEDENDIS